MAWGYIRQMSLMQLCLPAPGSWVIDGLLYVASQWESGPLATPTKPGSILVDNAIVGENENKQYSVTEETLGAHHASCPQRSTCWPPS
jgi:hypothetical protein